MHETTTPYSFEMNGKAKRKKNIKLNKESFTEVVVTIILISALHLISGGILI